MGCVVGAEGTLGTAICVGRWAGVLDFVYLLEESMNSELEHLILIAVAENSGSDLTEYVTIDAISRSLKVSEQDILHILSSFKEKGILIHGIGCVRLCRYGRDYYRKYRRDNPIPDIKRRLMMFLVTERVATVEYMEMVLGVATPDLLDAVQDLERDGGIKMTSGCVALI